MKLITNSFKTHMAKQFVESLDEPQNTIYYVGAHRSTRFPTEPSSVPDPGTSIEDTFYNLYDELIFGKHVTTEDVTHMIRNIPWTANTVYDMYDSVMTDPEEKNFYVVSPEAGSYHVFKCLNNNDGAASTYPPLRSQTEPEDEFYVTSDNYQWKFMYSITPSQYQKFATNAYVPLFANTEVASYAVNGSIDTIVIENAGSRYRSYAAGSIAEAAIGGNTQIFAIESSTMTLSSNANFYDNCSIYIDNGAGDGEIRTILDYYSTGGQRRIVVDRPFDTIPTRNSEFKIAPRVIISGDGQNASARAEVNSNGAITDVIIINRGSNYTFADIAVVGNTGSTSASTTSAKLRAIISPPGGHGSDPINELYANRVGISIDFDKSEANTIPVVNDYRKFTLIKDPLFDKADFVMTSAATGFTAGELVTQVSTGAIGKVVGRESTTLTLSNIRGFFVVSSNTSDANTGITGLSSDYVSYITSIDKSTFETFDQRKIYQIEVTNTGVPIGTGFITDEVVVQTGLNSIESPIVQLTLSGSGSAYAFVDGETITGNTSGSTATVTSRFDKVLTIMDMTGFFSVGEAVVGSTSGASRVITNYDNSFSATAVATIHEVGTYANGTGFAALTNVNGEFLTSDLLTNTINTFKGQTSQAIATVKDPDTSRNKLVDGSGEIMYVENFAAITRDADQTERVKLIIEF